MFGSDGVIKDAYEVWINDEYFSSCASERNVVWLIANRLSDNDPIIEKFYVKYCGQRVSDEIMKRFNQLIAKRYDEIRYNC
jgi:hypothetical protein